MASRHSLLTWEKHRAWRSRQHNQKWLSICQANMQQQHVACSVDASRPILLQHSFDRLLQGTVTGTSVD
jgi:hypothetical protein